MVSKRAIQSFKWKKTFNKNGFIENNSETNQKYVWMKINDWIVSSNNIRIDEQY